MALSDMGVYQTSNPEVARKVERAENAGVKNWIAVKVLAPLGDHQLAVSIVQCVQRRTKQEKPQ